MSDLFAESDERKRDRLRALGWRREHVCGRDCWVHPVTRAYYFDEREAFEALPPEPAAEA